MKVLVTGGTGFIGAHLVEVLVAAGDEVVVLDNLHRGDRARLDAIGRAARGGALRLIEGDVRDRDTVRAATAGVERVYHVAAQSNVLGAVSDLHYSFTSNVVGTYNVLVAAREAAVGRLVFSSSREVYGEVDQVPVAEDRPLNPKNAYGASKVAGEVYCRVFQDTYGLDVSVLRLANVYGPGDRDRVIPIWLDRARRGEDLELYGGTQVLDFVPVGLVVEALRRAAERSLGGQPLNVGSGVGTTLYDLAARIQALSGAAVGLRVLPARAVEVTRFVADVSRMRALLGLEPPSDPLVALPDLWNAVRRG
jgi:nucleoside-diphosphate-sugar epimerase